jgi:hypothetical protein
MSLADALNNEVAMRKGPQCSVAAILDALDDSDRAALVAAFASTQPSTSIARALLTINVRIAPTTLSRHRRGECSCG